LLTKVRDRKPVDFAILRALAIDSNEVEQQIMKAFPAYETYMIDFGFSSIHNAVLELYDVADNTRPSLQDLLDFVDDANNQPAGNNWSIWRRAEAKTSPLYADIVEMFRTTAGKVSSARKVILDLINQPDEKWGWPPFHWAAFTGRKEMMKILIKNNADPFILSPMQRNAIHIAAESKRSEVLSYVLEIWKKNKKKLDINKEDRWKETPLHIAAYGSSACVKLLLDNHADPNAKQEDQQIPLHYPGICTREDEKVQIVSVLSSLGRFFLDAQDDNGRTPVFGLLSSPACLQILAENGADLTITDNAGNSPLHKACMDNEAFTLEKLLSLTSDPSAVTRLNAKGNTPFLEACAHKSKECAQVLLRRADVDCTVVGEKGWAAVHYAGDWGDKLILKAVLTHSSFKRGQKTKDGRSAEMLTKAACKWDGRIKDLLKKYDSIAGTIREIDSVTFSQSAYLSMR
jgi:ankyrin repeat protein